MDKTDRPGFYVRDVFLVEYITQGGVASKNKSRVLCFLSAPSPVRFLQLVRVVGRLEMCCSFSSVSCAVRVFSVENLWRSLRESLLKKCGKVSTCWPGGEFYTRRGGENDVFHGAVEKFSYGFSTWIYRVKWVVLHSFHRAYYNYYYYISEFLGGTAEMEKELRKVNI